MIPDIKERIYSERISIRILWLTVAFVVIFYGVTILSYFLLPEGFLLKKNSVPLMERIIRTFDIIHNAGLLEMYGQLLITGALALEV